MYDFFEIGDTCLGVYVCSEFFLIFGMICMVADSLNLMETFFRKKQEYHSGKADFYLITAARVVGIEGASRVWMVMRYYSSDLVGLSCGDRDWENRLFVSRLCENNSKYERIHV